MLSRLGGNPQGGHRSCDLSLLRSRHHQNSSHLSFYAPNALSDTRGSQSIIGEFVILAYARGRLGGAVFTKLKRVGPLAALSVLTVVTLGLTACTDGNTGGGDQDINTVSAELSGAVDEAVANALTLSGSTEAVIGVWTPDGQAYVRGFGEGVTSATTFTSAQASQPVMCAMLLTLVETGELSLDRKVSEDLTRLPGIEDLTYAQLCDQTSGIKDFKSGLTERFTNNPTRPWPEQELIANGLAGSPLAWAGKNVYLSDTNALLLDRAVRLHTRSSTSDLLKLHVFEPAGLKSTTYPSSFDSREIPSGGLTPLTYPVSGNTPQCEAGVTTLTNFSPSMIRGAGATRTTVGDLKKFYDSYFDGAFGELDVASETRLAQNPERNAEGEPTNEPDPNGRQIGFGGIEKIGPLFGRSGSVTGTMTAAYTDPSTGLTVIVALNNSTAGSSFTQALAFQLAALTGAELPWSAEDQAAKLAEKAICQVDPAAEESAE